MRTAESPLSATSSGQSSDDERRGGVHPPCHGVSTSHASRSGHNSTNTHDGFAKLIFIAGRAFNTSRLVGRTSRSYGACSTTPTQLLETTPLVASCASEHSSASPISGDLPSARAAGIYFVKAGVSIVLELPCHRVVGPYKIYFIVCLVISIVIST